jgi:RNA polymerase-associated protein RTF1
LSSEDEFDEKLYRLGDENDRHYIDSLPEVAREQELATRYEKQKLAKERREQRMKLKEKKREERRRAALPRQVPRRGKATGKSLSLAQLKKLRQHTQKAKKKNEDSHSRSGGSESESASESESEDEEKIDEEMEESDDERMAGRDDKETEKESEGEEEGDLEGRVPAVFDDIQSLILRRFQLEQWVNEPYFESVVVGCFVRVSLSGRGDGKRKYRVCRIASVTEGRRYEVGGKPTRWRLKLAVGSLQKDFAISLISNQKATANEYEEWCSQATVAREHIPIPSKKEVAGLKKKLTIPNTYVYTPKDIDDMVLYQTKLRRIPVNIASSLVSLRERRELLSGDGHHDSAELEKVDAQIKSLEEVSDRLYQREVAARHLDVMVKINEKNRKENLKQITDASHDTLGAAIARRETRPISLQRIFAEKSDDILKLNQEEVANQEVKEIKRSGSGGEIKVQGTL